MQMIPEDSVNVTAENVDTSNMFDNYINTQTSNADAIELTVDANKISHFALFNLDAYDIEWWLKNSGGTTVTSGTIDLTLSTSVAGIEYKSDISQNVAAWVFNGSLVVHINKTGGTAKCGAMIIGRGENIGNTQFGVETGHLDYSKYETNDFGYTFLSQGSWAKKNRIKAWLDTARNDRIIQVLAQNRATLVVWDANENATDFEPLLLYGWYRKASIKFQHQKSILTLDLQGIT